MAHDLLAELAGYKNELERYVLQERTERAAAVREQIGRVRGVISEHIEALEAEAAENADAGRDARAGECAMAARPFKKALEDSEDLVAGSAARAPKENAAESKPRQTASRSGKSS